MEVMDKLPFYAKYMMLLENRSIAEKEIEELENPERQLHRVKKFYRNLGADPDKNRWIVQMQEDMETANWENSSRLHQLKQEMRESILVENAVKKQDMESIQAMLAYKGDESYQLLAKQILFFVIVSRVKSELGYIERAYQEIDKLYNPANNTAVFLAEGVYYYIYYLQCLKTYMKKYSRISMDDNIRHIIQERCMNLSLMCNSYSENLYIGEEIEKIRTELLGVQALLQTC
ncbi:MAG: hypothetical protein IKV59_07770 [Lachnospiraceae bacterium]|nr:hypothetical protein [Lachnospiraceae bacterium]